MISYAKLIKAAVVEVIMDYTEDSMLTPVARGGRGNVPGPPRETLEHRAPHSMVLVRLVGNYN